MTARMITVVVLLTAVSVAKAEVAVVVELVPDNPGPYVGGESLTVDVWLQSEVPGDKLLALVQLDLSDTDPRLGLDPTFRFDFSSVPQPYATEPQLPVPRAWNFIQCVCPQAFFLLPSGGSLHIGSIGLQLPSEGGVYDLDVLNADEPDEAFGARIELHLSSTVWRAFTGEIAGGTFDFAVAPPIPTVSGWGVIAMSLLLVALGSAMIMRRNPAAKSSMSASTVDNRRTSRTDSVLISLCAAGLSLGSIETLMAQPAPVPSEKVPISIDSGWVSATGMEADHVLAFSEVVSAPGAPWMRLHFQQVQLSGSAAAGNESFLRITSLEDGAVQLLDSLALTRWRNTSAYFNGGQVLVELLAYPSTGKQSLAYDTQPCQQGARNGQAHACPAPYPELISVTIR